MPEIVCYAAGLTKISFARFIIVHTVIDIPVTAMLVGAGMFFTLDPSPLLILILVVSGTIATIVGGAWFYRKTK